jgi:hypothetical protein
MLEGCSDGSLLAGQILAPASEIPAKTGQNQAPASEIPAKAGQNQAKKSLRDLAHEIQALHDLARSGEVPTDVAERQLNSYLLAVGRGQARLVMHIADAPHHSLLPDLGYVVHRILAQNPLQGSLSGALQQCLPVLRHTSRSVTYEDSQAVLLNLLLALLLGLYPGGGVKKPRFEARAVLFTRLHSLLTGTPEEQTAFCQANAATIQLACMEYVTRVLPAVAPSQTAFVHERDASSIVYFRRVPAMCDEFRQSLDSPDPPSWAEILAMAVTAIERLARLKKTSGSQSARESPSTTAVVSVHGRPQDELAAYWRVPYLLGCPSLDEFRVLGQGLGLNGSLIGHIQRDLQVWRLSKSENQEI